MAHLLKSLWLKITVAFELTADEMDPPPFSNGFNEPN